MTVSEGLGVGKGWGGGVLMFLLLVEAVRRVDLSDTKNEVKEKMDAGTLSIFIYRVAHKMLDNQGRNYAASE